MKLDAWGVYTVSTAAFYMLGAAVLNLQPGMRPEGPAVMEVLSGIFRGTVGQWGGMVFLIGAGVALLRRLSPTCPDVGMLPGITGLRTTGHC